MKIKLRWLGIIGMIAALIGCVGDVFLLYAPQGGYENQDYLFFNSIPLENIRFGHYLGVLFIPFELVGFLQVFYALRPSKSKLLIPLIAATIYVMVIGVAYHGMVGIGGIYLKTAGGAAVTEHFPFIVSCFEPLGFVLFLVFLFISFSLSYLIYFKKTLYPKWVAFTAPFFSYLVIVLVYLINKPIGSALMVAGFNLSIFVLLLVSTVVLWEESDPELETIVGNDHPNLNE